MYESEDSPRVSQELQGSRPIPSIEMGAKMIRRLMCDVSTRGKHTKHKKSFAKRKMALILAPST